jgi:hypothetical protein
MTSNLTPLQQLMFSLIEIWQSSGQSQKSFCHEKDLAYSKFHYWYRKYQEYRSASSSGEPLPDEPFGRAFVAVTVKKASTLDTVPAGVLELVFPEGRRLIFNQGVEAGFLKTLLG